MKLLQYGAGSIGRGFIGPLFAAAGYEVVFVDVNPALVAAFNARKRYHYTVAAAPPYDVAVQNIRAVDGRDAAAVCRELADCDILATALGAAVLERVAPTLAQGLRQRWAQGNAPLDILICENLKNAAQALGGWLAPSLEDAVPDWRSRCGLVEAVIGRMVPVAQNSADPLHITVEEYGLLPVDAAAFRGSVPNVPNLLPYSPFAFYEERKLYLHNMGHCICAALGLQSGIEALADAIAMPEIYRAVREAMAESAAMLSRKYNQPLPELTEHAADLLRRFGNRALGDSCERVARDPLRKLSADDRLAGALRNCEALGLPCTHIARGYAAVLRGCTADFARAKEIMSDISHLSPELAKICGDFFNQGEGQ